MNDQIDTLLALPFEFQLALAAGYIGYAIAFSEARSRHDVFDAGMLTLVFGLITILIFRQALEPLGELAAAGLAFLATVIAGALWTLRLRSWWRRAARHIGVTIEDGSPNVFASVFQDPRFPVMGLTVRCRSGRVLHSDGMRRHFEAPFGPCVLGPDGSVGLYVTEITAADGTVTPWDPHQGAPQLTLIPAAEVLEIDIRHHQ